MHLVFGTLKFFASHKNGKKIFSTSVENTIYVKYLKMLQALKKKVQSKATGHQKQKLEVVEQVAHTLYSEDVSSLISLSYQCSFMKGSLHMETGQKKSPDRPQIYSNPEEP